MTKTEIKQQIENKIAAANVLILQLLAGTAAADAEDQIEALSDEAEILSDRLAVLNRAPTCAGSVVLQRGVSPSMPSYWRR
jgi:hypothetical protein